MRSEQTAPEPNSTGVEKTGTEAGTLAQSALRGADGWRRVSQARCVRAARVPRPSGQPLTPALSGSSVTRQRPTPISGSAARRFAQRAPPPVSTTPLSATSLGEQLRQGLLQHHVHRLDQLLDRAAQGLANFLVVDLDGFWAAQVGSSRPMISRVRVSGSASAEPSINRHLGGALADPQIMPALDLVHDGAVHLVAGGAQ